MAVTNINRSSYRCMKSFFALFISFAVLSSSTLLSQENYREYYRHIDSAHYFLAKKDKLKAKQKYLTAFAKFEGFASDYFTFAHTCSFQNKDSLYLYLALSNLYGEHRIDIRYFSKQKLKFDEKCFRMQLKTLKRQYPIEKDKNLLHNLKRMFRKDQAVRRGDNWEKLTKQDSIHNIQLKYLVQNDLLKTNRLALGRKGIMYLDVLFAHQGFDNIQSYFMDILRIAETGTLNRKLLSYNLERESVFGGSLFTIENKQIKRETTIKNRMIDAKRKIYYSSLGESVLWIDHANRGVNPNPSITIDKLEELRSFLMLPSIKIKNEIHRAKKTTWLIQN